MPKTIGIDIGGTKVAAAVYSDEGKLSGRVEVPSNTLNSETMFQSVQHAVMQTLKKSSITLSEIDGIGAGVPGKIDHENGIAVYQNNLPWRNFPIVERLKKAFKIEKIVIDNDVCMAAYSEWKDAGGNQNITFSYITISTGIACSTIQNGSYIRGAGFAGELGLIPVVAPCLKNNKVQVERLELTSSGFSLQKIGSKLLGNPQLRTKDLFIEYRKGNKDAIELINSSARSIAHGIYALICLIDPHHIHLGGSVMVYNPFFLDLVKNELAKLAIPEQSHIFHNIRLSKLGQDNGVLGAAMRAMDIK